MNSWQRDKAWSDRFIPAIKQAVGPLLLEAAPLELDAFQATDLVVFRARDMRIAARVRKIDYMARYGDEFTIRSQRQTGTVTELAKIMGGWGDWLFYGFGDGTTVVGWRVIDLAVFRRDIARLGYRAFPKKEMDNHDGTYFAAFNVSDFRPDLIIAEHMPARASAA